MCGIVDNIAHDFAYDFWYARQLRNLRLVEALPGIEALLALSVDDYVSQLGTVFL